MLNNFAKSLKSFKNPVHSHSNDSTRSNLQYIFVTCVLHLIGTQINMQVPVYVGE